MFLRIPTAIRRRERSVRTVSKYKYRDQHMSRNSHFLTVFAIDILAWPRALRAVRGTLVYAAIGGVPQCPPQPALRNRGSDNNGGDVTGESAHSRVNQHTATTLTPECPHTSTWVRRHLEHRTLHACDVTHCDGNSRHRLAERTYRYLATSIKCFIENEPTAPAEQAHTHTRRQ